MAAGDDPKNPDPPRGVIYIRVATEAQLAALPMPRA